MVQQADPKRSLLVEARDCSRTSSRRLRSAFEFLHAGPEGNQIVDGSQEARWQDFGTRPASPYSCAHA